MAMSTRRGDVRETAGRGIPPERRFLAHTAFLVVLLLLGPLAGCGNNYVPSPYGGEILLIPRPRSLLVREGYFRLPRRIRIAVTSGEDDDVFAAGLLVDDLSAAGVRHVSIARGKSGHIALTRGRSRDDVGEEGYRLDVSPRGVTVAAP